jgi:L-fuculose-phosphate aldolase
MGRSTASLDEVRTEIARVCRLAWERGLIAAKDGNVSVRVGDRLLVTPSGATKGDLDPASIVLTDLEGRPEPDQLHRASSEIAMHCAVYAERPDVGAVIHAHPPCAVAHTIAKIPLEPLMPEALVELGRVPTLAFTLPGTRAVPDAVRGRIRDHDVLMLSRHGSLCVGADLREAHHRLEVLEHTARISLYARQLSGAVTPLDPATQAALRPDVPPE